MPSSRLVLAEYFNIHDVIRSRSHTHPPRLLRAFSETRDLAPGVSKRVELTLDRIPVSYWDERIGRWVIEHGEHGERWAEQRLRVALDGELHGGQDWSRMGCGDVPVATSSCCSWR